MKTGCVLLPFVVLLSCANVESMESTVSSETYPTHWPELQSGTFTENQCVSIAGQYQSRGESNSKLSENFSNPIFERNFFNQVEIASESNYFNVTLVPGEKRLAFDIFSRKNEVLAEGLFKQYSKCESGWIISESYVKGGSGDNPTRSQRETTRMFLADDGSLLVNSRLEVVSGKYIVGSETQVSNIWYRFIKTKPGSEPE